MNNSEYTKIIFYLKHNISIFLPGGGGAKERGEGEANMSTISAPKMNKQIKIGVIFIIDFYDIRI